MSLDSVTNFALATVNQGYDDVATSIDLVAGQGARFPNPAVDGAFNLTWWDSTNYTNAADAYNAGAAEIVRCTARSTDTLTVTRAQESTAAITHNSGGVTYKMSLSFTKKSYDDIDSGNFATLNVDGIADFKGAITNTVDNNDNYVALTITNNDVTNNPNCLNITNAGTGNGLFLDQNGNGLSLSIDSEATTIGAVQIFADVMTSGYPLAVRAESASFSGIVGQFRIGNSSATGDCIVAYQAGSGVPVGITNTYAVSTNFYRGISLNGHIIWVSNGTTPNGNLSGTAGDICTNADSGKAYYCTGTTNWTAM